ncbi:AIM24 family protein [Paludibacterium denitrificans]
MDTIFGDGSAAQSGLMGKLLGAGKRLLTGESLFTSVFVNRGHGKRRVAFAAATPGKIVPVHLLELGGVLYAQKDSFLCAAKGVSLGIALQKKFGVGLFGGEGFILQKLEGDGYVFLHAGGTLTERQLAPGETLRVDTGCLVAYQPTVSFDIEYVGKIKSALFVKRRTVPRRASAGRAKSGCNRYRCHDWPTACWQPPRVPGASRKNKARCWVDGWATATANAHRSGNRHCWPIGFGAKIRPSTEMAARLFRLNGTAWCRLLFIQLPGHVPSHREERLAMSWQEFKRDYLVRFWSPVPAVIAAGVLSAYYFGLTGTFWAVTGEFTRWGGHLLQLLGYHPETRGYFKVIHLDGTPLDRVDGMMILGMFA